MQYPVLALRPRMNNTIRSCTIASFASSALLGNLEAVCKEPCCGFNGKKPRATRERPIWPLCSTGSGSETVIISSTWTTGIPSPLLYYTPLTASKMERFAGRSFGSANQEKVFAEISPLCTALRAVQRGDFGVLKFPPSVHRARYRGDFGLFKL